MANRRTLDEQIDAALKEREQKDKRIKDLLGRKRTKEDKARTNRLCKRGGLVEKLHPRLAKFTDEQFSLFVDLVLKSEHTMSVIDEIMPPEPEEAESDTDTADGKPAPKPESGNAAPQSDDTRAQKTAQTPQNGGTGGNAHNGNRPPQNNNHNTPRPANTQYHNNGGGNGNGGNGEGRTS